MTKILTRTVNDKANRKVKRRLTAQRVSEAVAAFWQFLSEVETEFFGASYSVNNLIEKRNKLLNGGANTAAFALIDEQVRKRFGIFFSGHALANHAASKISALLNSGASIIDPACGAGDLLIACARHYPIQKDFVTTLNFWESRLAGIDLHDIFINAARSRFKLLATEAHAPEFSSAASIKFPYLIAGNAYSKLELIKEYDAVITNPPYGDSIAPKNISWAKGKIQTAALFLSRILENSKPGQNIVAILPDVLRSGTRYEKWRSWVAKRADILSIDIVGKFDKTTDVDVFVLHLAIDENNSRNWPNLLNNISEKNVTLGDLFEVRVGPVVPHRDKENGEPTLYIDSSHTSDRVDLIPNEYKKYQATTYEAPFVVVHRTSSPNDKTRIIASIINSTEKILVENHLIILKPRDGRLETCRELLPRLQDSSITAWLNNRIRCRHLTVSAIKEIPLVWS